MAGLNYGFDPGTPGTFMDSAELEMFQKQYQDTAEEMKLTLKQLDDEIARNAESAPQLIEMREKCQAQLQKLETLFESTVNFRKEYMEANNAVVQDVSKLILEI